MINKRSFTMAELLVVMFIISIMAAFGIPSFTKAMARAKARDAINNLTIIHAAQNLYNSSNGGYFTAATLADINTAFSLNLISSDATNYVCTPPKCWATAKGGQNDFQVTVDLTLPIVSGATPNPGCSSLNGYCPY